MGDTWLKIKAWTKGILAALLAAYIILFVYNNSGDRVNFWFWFGHYPYVSAFFLAVVAFVAGAVCAVLVSTTWRTMRQVREIRSGRRLEKLEREQADLRAKAGLLATHPAVAVETDPV